MHLIFPVQALSSRSVSPSARMKTRHLKHQQESFRHLDCCLCISAGGNQQLDQIYITSLASMHQRREALQQTMLSELGCTTTSNAGQFCIKVHENHMLLRQGVSEVVYS